MIELRTEIRQLLAIARAPFGAFEAVVILDDGRAAVPHLWALILVALFTVILLMPLSVLANGLGLLPDARALRTFIWPHR